VLHRESIEYGMLLSLLVGELDKLRPALLPSHRIESSTSPVRAIHVRPTLTPLHPESRIHGLRALLLLHGTLVLGRKSILVVVVGVAAVSDGELRGDDSVVGELD